MGPLGGITIVDEDEGSLALQQGCPLARLTLTMCFIILATSASRCSGGMDASSASLALTWAAMASIRSYLEE